MRLTTAILILAVTFLGGCQEAAAPIEPIAAVPLAKDVVLPEGMPDDQWFYNEVVSSEVPVVVDFGATWCPPCRQLKPLLQELSAKAEGRYKVVMIDVDERQYLSQHFRVSGIPHLMLFHQGKVKRNNLGPLDRDALAQFATAPTE